MLLPTMFGQGFMSRFLLEFLCLSEYTEISHACSSYVQKGPSSFFPYKQGEKSWQTCMKVQHPLPLSRGPLYLEVGVLTDFKNREEIGT